MGTPNLQIPSKGLQAAAIRQVHQEQLSRAERFNGRAAMLGLGTLHFQG